MLILCEVKKINLAGAPYGMSGLPIVGARNESPLVIGQAASLSFRDI